MSQADRPTQDRYGVLITGAAKRIGRAIAEALAADGWPVAVHYHSSRDAAEQTAEALREAGSPAAPVEADLSNADDVETLIDRASSALGCRLAVLVNNASVFELDTVDTADRESWDRHLDPNLWAPLRLSQQFARQLPEDQPGNIINLLDQRVWNLTPQFISYTVSKTGLWTLTQTLAMALAPRIRVNAIGPGPTVPSPRQTEEHFERQWRSVPLQRPTDPTEIGRAARFILDMPAMTGQMIALDGGQHLGGGGTTIRE